MAAVLPSSNATVQPLAFDQRHEGVRRTVLALGSSSINRPALSTEAAATPKVDFAWPVDSYIVQGMWSGHPSGIDIGAEIGRPVKAVRDGTVAFAGGDPCCEYGRFVIIAHDKGFSSVYGHLSRIDVKVGQVLHQGDVLGLVGVTGKTTGPHLHFELRLNGVPVDPLRYLVPHKVAPPPPPDPTPTRTATSRAPALVAGSQPSQQLIAPTAAAARVALTSQAAIALGSAWLAANGDAQYTVDAATCAATTIGPNFSVSCIGRLGGCSATNAECLSTLVVCVYDQPRMVSRSCP